MTNAISRGGAARVRVSSHVHSVTDMHRRGPRSSLGPVSIVLEAWPASVPEMDDTAYDGVNTVPLHRIRAGHDPEGAVG